MTEHLVSIVIATYNHGKYIAEVIESVLAQTHKNIEVIVIDDGSTDDTANIVKKYPVKYVHQDNRGPSNAFNVGIRMSHGEFYFTPGADDKLHPQYVELCLKEMLKDSRIGFVWTGAQEFGSAHSIRTPIPLRNRFSIYRGPGGQLGAALFRRRAYEEAGGYDETLPIYEDWDLAIRLVKRGWKGQPVLEPIYYWRRHTTSRNIQASPGVLIEIMEKKYPRIKLYIQLARFLDFCALVVSNPQESAQRLFRRVR